MKCSQCYADNEVWSTVCNSCGESLTPIELCQAGHILPPGSRLCARCPSAWPETPAYEGPPVLRGLFWVERGRVVRGSEQEPIPYFEVRDRCEPLVLVEVSPTRLSLVDGDEPNAIARLLVRPDGVRVCTRQPDSARQHPTKLGYELVASRQALDLGPHRLRFIAFEVPAGPTS